MNETPIEKIKIGYDTSDYSSITIIKFKTFHGAKIYFVSNILPKLENEDGLPTDTLFNLWLENPTDYQPDVVVEIQEGTDTTESDRYDLLTHN